MAKENDEQYSHVLKFTGLFGGVQGLNVVIGLVRNKFVALLLGPGGMGLVSLFNTTVQLISQATHLGISFSAVRAVWCSWTVALFRIIAMLYGQAGARRR